jgi:hypothetical protein
VTYPAPGGGRGRDWRRLGASTVALAGLTLLSGCRAAPAPALSLDEGRLIVLNQTGREWREIEIWINDHYRVTVATIAPGGRFVAPLNTFVAGFGQRLDPGRQPVRGVELTGRDETGASVKLVWGEGRRR